MRIVAVPGRQVRDPVTRRVVDETGVTIDPLNLYWARLLDDGDVAKAPDGDPDAGPVEPAPAAIAAPAEETKA